ncbi:uncharacterized protein H6S33_009289 [Morchella sextelata]|uniref:uncharacterized protein n=1 Tax=Morchella sextelata TaxID=1174677 RepID=UPI001D0467D0|nr:uncharacterized protein H6S33_009289 [Morchella sextelata]KAH0612909.1 hypothetical protein H6S33_009289 [Morchella sextelata]
MPKHRFPPKPQSNKRKNKKVPETADEFLDVGIEHEESGDRWRPGDKLKAGRFYEKAIDSYNTALQLNPTSFDAAYNLARLQYQLAQHPELTGSTHRSSRLLLKTAVDSHRRCLALDPANEDALFNTGQVLCSFAEVLIEYRTAPVEAKTEAAQLLVEAVGTLQRCLALQEAQYAALQQTQTQAQEAGDDTSMDMGDEPASSSSTPSEPNTTEQWAIIQPPTTPSTLLDTTLALLSTLATLLPLTNLPHCPPLSTTLHTAQHLLTTTIPPLAHATSRESEAALSRANLLAAAAEASYRAGGPLADYEAGVAAAFDGVDGVQALCDRADAHIQLAGSVSDDAVAWRHYSFAAQYLAGAAAAEPGRGEIHVARGDVELLRARLGVDVAVRSRGVLVRNAGVYYRGARRLGGGVEGEAAVKERMVVLESGGEGVEEAARGIVEGGEAVWGVVVEAVEEGLVGGEWLERVGGRVGGEV